MYAVIDRLVTGIGLAVTAVCQALSVSRSGFYAWQDEREAFRTQRDRELMPLIRNIFWRHKRRYGARRIAQELRFQGEPCGASRETPENRGFAGDSAEVVPSEDDREPPHVGLQSEPAA